MAQTGIIDVCTESINQPAVVCHANETAKGEHDEKPFPFLRLPAEIRNTIYLDLISSHADYFDNERLRSQPAITRVNRQLRAEALPICYGGISVLLVETENPSDWVPFIQRVVGAFTSGPGGLAGSSTLRYLDGLQLDFMATRSPGVHIQVDMVVDPEDLTDPCPASLDPCERFRVGSSGLDWTDAAIVRAACDEAAPLLEKDLMTRRFTTEENAVIVATSDVSVQKAALDALCVFASACPHLTSVSICDSSRIHSVDILLFDCMSYDEVRAWILAGQEE